MPKFLSKLFACLLFSTAILHADTIVTNDGSRIEGKILGIENDVIRIQTNFAGVLNVAQDKTQSVSTDNPVFVEFSGGNTLYGVVSSEGSDTIRVVAQDGEFRSKIDKVQASWHSGEDSPTVRAHKAELAAAKGQWTNEIAAEIAGTSGNTDSLDTGISFNAELESTEGTLTFYGSYNYSETENEVSTDKSKGGVRYERNINTVSYTHLTLPTIA